MEILWYSAPIMNNQGQKSVRYIVFKEEGSWHAVALEFNIVESGDDPREVLIMLFEAIKGYIDSAIKNNIPEVLNQKPAEEYENLWKKLSKHEPVPSPFSVFTHGETNLANL